MNNRTIYGYFGHHKCASTWLEKICGNVCSDLGLKYSIVYSAKDCDYDLKGYIEKNKIDFIAFANADYNLVKDIEDLKGFHVVRDLRDIVVSAYFSHRFSHPTHAWPELLPHREKLNKLSESDGIIEEIKFSEEQFDTMKGWEACDNKNITEIHMEDIIQDEYKAMLRVFDNMGLIDNRNYTFKLQLSFFINTLLRKAQKLFGIPMPRLISKIPAERLLGAVWENDFKRITKGRKQGEEDRNSHYRKGVAGDWKNYFTNEHKKLMKERYQDVLEQYAYVKDRNW
jgi:hypothetical protein